MFYESRGEGEPLILIPGFASGAWNWHWQTKDLAKYFQVIIFDPRGIGKSKVETENDLKNLSMRVFAEDVLRILDELEDRTGKCFRREFRRFCRAGICA